MWRSRCSVTLRALMRGSAAAASVAQPSFAALTSSSGPCSLHALSCPTLSSLPQPQVTSAIISCALEGWSVRHLHTSWGLLSKKGKGAKGGAGHAHADGSEAPDFDLDPYERLMQHAVQHFRDELGRIHGGRASPGLLEPIEVPGQHPHERALPLKTYGAVTARSAALLVVAAYDIKNLELIAKAIRESPLKLQARVEGKEVHVPMPRPTLEQVKGMMKLVAQESEKGKTSIRAARHKALEAAKQGLKARDDRERATKEVQAMTDRYVSEVERVKAAKEKELHDLK